VRRGGGGDAPSATTRTAAAPRSSTTATAAAPRAVPTPTSTRIVVRSGKPLGGVQRIKVRTGQQVRIDVSSPDTSGQVRLHGYELKRDLRAGGQVRLAFRASTAGTYEIGLERAGVKLGELVVAP
jgi:hypothetical protein